MEVHTQRDLKRFATKKEGQVKALEWVRNVLGRARLRHKTVEAKNILDDLERIIDRARVMETEELMQLRKQSEQIG